MNNSPWNTRRDFLHLGRLTLGAGAFGVALPTVAFGAGAHIKVLNSAGMISNVMVAMVQNLRLGEKFDLDIEYLNLADGNKIVGGLIGNDGDICGWSGFPQVLPAIEKGGKLKIIGGSIMVPILAIYSAKPNIQSLKDLTGKTVTAGSPGSLIHMGTVAMLRKYGIDEKSVQFANTGSSQDAFRAIVTGTVDAGISEVAIHDQLDKLGLHSVRGGAMWDELPEFTSHATYTSENAIARKRDILVRLLALNATLFRFLQSPGSWDEWEKAYRSQSGGNYDSVQAKTFWNFIQQRKIFATDLVMSEERIRYVQDLNISVGTQKSLLPYSQVADMSLAQEALKLLDKS